MQPIPETSPRFSNLQLELLRLYARDISDEELRDIKRLLANYFAQRVIGELTLGRTPITSPMPT